MNKKVPEKISNKKNQIKKKPKQRKIKQREGKEHGEMRERERGPDGERKEESTVDSSVHYLNQNENKNTMSRQNS